MPQNLYRRGNTWWARVQVRGREIRRSLHTDNKAEARKRLKRHLEDMSHARYHGEERHTWKAAVGRWTLEFLPSIKPSTGDRYVCSLNQVADILEPLYLDEIDRKKIAEIVSVRKLMGATNATIRRDLTAASSVLSACVAWGWCETNAALSYDRRQVRERRDPIRLPEASEIDAVAALAPGNFAKLIRFAQYTGMRQEEAASLERHQIRAAEATLTRTKTNKPRTIPLDDRAVGTYSGTVRHASFGAVDDDRKIGSYVFSHGKGERYQNVSSRFARYVAMAVKAGNARHFRFHDLRHWYAVDYLKRGGSIYDLQHVLGHASIKTTEIYLAFLTPDQKGIAMRVGTKVGTVQVVQIEAKTPDVD